MNKGEAININIGELSALTHGLVSYFKESSASSSSVKSIFIDTKASLQNLNYEESYDLEINDFTSDIKNCCQKAKSNSLYYEKIKFGSCDKIVPIIKNYTEEESCIFESIDFIDSSHFIDNFDETLRYLVEKTDYVEGFHLISEFFTHVSFSLFRVIENICDEFPNRFKQIFGIWECGSDIKKLADLNFLNSLLVSESLKFPNVNIIPLNAYRKIMNSSSYEVVSLNSWGNSDIKLDLNEVTQRAKIYAYSIESYRSISNLSEFGVSDVLECFSNLWGSGGSLSGLNFYTLPPTNKDIFYFDFIDKPDLEYLNKLCLTQGFDVESLNISYQVVSLNNHPDLLLPESGDKKILSHISKNIKYFDFRFYDKTMMLETYLEKTYPSTCSFTNYLSNPFISDVSFSFFPSLTRIYTGPSAASLLNTFSHNIDRYSRKNFKFCLKNFDFSTDSLNEHSNNLQQKIETINPEFRSQHN